MNNDLWKIFGVLSSVLWLLAVGFYATLAFFFALDAPESQQPRLQLASVFEYIVFGLGPVCGFILLMKKRYEPIGFSGLVVLATCAAIPLALFLLHFVVSLL